MASRLQTATSTCEGPSCSRLVRCSDYIHHRQRNPVRPELERRYGYDTKHAMHLVRLMRMGLEVLQHGELRVRRSDAEELRAIRDGALSFDALLETAAALEERMRQAVNESALPLDVDHAEVDRLAIELMLDAGS